MARDIEPTYMRTYELLRDRCGEPYAGQYLSAIFVLADADVPERHAMAAHELREVIENLYKASPVPLEDPKGRKSRNISNDLKALAPEWKAAWQVEEWDAPVDWRRGCDNDRACDALNRLHELIAAADRLPLALDRLVRASADLDPSPLKAPKDAYEPAATSLRRVQRYFIEVAHGRPVDVGAFGEQLNRMGVLLRAILAEAPVEDFDAIDAALAEVERGE